MDYDLSRLSSRTFEQLVQALAVKVIAPGIIVFGDGPDGGREAAYSGQVPYPSTTEQWDGQLVVQAKFRQRPQGTDRDTNWAINELKKEFEQTFGAKSRRSKPTHYILATNVTLSSVPDSGGKARAEALADEFGLDGFRLWDYDQLRTFLDGDEDVRNAYMAYITSGDVLAELMGSLDGASRDFDKLIANFLEKELLSDQYANLEQAGRIAEEQIPISRVFIDLPVRSIDDTDEKGEFLTEMLRMAEQSLHSQSESAPADRAQGVTIKDARPPGRVVLIGGPGQGKTTVGQFLCQLFRIELLKGRPQNSLTPEARAAIQLTESQCAKEGIPVPRIRRFPIRISLTELSDTLAHPSRIGTLLEFMAATVSNRTGHQIKTEVFQHWLGRYPWLLVLDGLDEVPASSNRKAVMDIIRDFWVDATAVNADLMVLATTRPQGYNDDFSPDLYRHFALSPLSPDRALHYGTRLAEARHGTDERRQEKIVGRLVRAARTPATANLMTSPLQVTIMATLVDRRGQPPQERWKLFSEYYGVIFNRELEKEIPAAHILREHKPDIDAIHYRVALLLQVEGERVAHAEARMSSDRFGAIVSHRLEEEGYGGKDLEELQTEIIKAATNRLVFLVGLESDAVGFEIRSLQEFMAAEALMDGADARVTDRLRAIAGVTSWRNVFLFAAGQCFAERQYLRDTINTVCSQLNDGIDDPMAPVVLPGSLLAADLLADGFARKQPAYSRLLAGEALRLVDRASAAPRLTEAYQDTLREVYAEILERGLGVDDRAGPTALLLQLSQEGLGWADTILDSHLPAGSAGFTEALGAREGISGGWLARRSQNALADMSLADIDRHRHALEPVAPSSLSGTGSLVDFLDHSWLDTRISVPLKGIPEQDLILGLQSAVQPMSQLASVLDASGHELLTTTRVGLEAITRFSFDPTARELGRQLEAVRDSVPAEDWGVLARISPWPLGTILAFAERNPNKLVGLIGLAHEGRLGDKATWRAAEGRWLSQRVRLADLDAVPSIDAPFDRTIGEHGIPQGPIRWSARTSSTAALTLLSWLRKATTAGARQAVTRWMLSLATIAHHEESEGGELSAEELSEFVLELDLNVPELRRYQVVAAMRWNEVLSSGESQLLDDIGRSLVTVWQGPIWGEEGPAPRLPSELQPCWNSGAERSDGFFRLVALGVKPNKLAIPVPPPSREMAERNPGADGLLEMKGPWDADLLERAVGKIAAIAASESIWLAQAIILVEARSRYPLAEMALSLLWDASEQMHPAERQDLRTMMEQVGSRWVNRRATKLDEPATWSKLEFFDRPPSSHGDPAA